MCLRGICHKLRTIKAFDTILLLAIGFLVAWNVHKFYFNVKEYKGAGHDVTTPPGQLTVTTLRESISRQKTEPSSIDKILNKQTDVNEAKYGQYLKLVLNSPDHCRRSGQADDVLLVILVLTSAQYFKTRQNWRESVEIRQHKQLRVLFVTEKPSDADDMKKLREEHKKFGDIMTLNFTGGETKVMGPSLTTLGGLRWIRNFCPQTGFVMKVGADTLVMVSSVLEYLDNLAPNVKENLFTGRFIHRNAWVQRTGEWAASKQEWPTDNYPDYVENLAAFLSGKAASIMADTSRKSEIYKFCDVYLGVLANEAETRIFATAPEAGFSAASFSEAKDAVTDYCKMKKYLFIYGDGADLQKGWDTLKERKELLCPTL